jgi:Flp pilus assembly pilin Flp
VVKSPGPANDSLTRKPVCVRRGRPESDSRHGQTLVEYALILAIISILAIAMMIQLTGNTRQIYSNIDSQVSRANVGS